MEKGISFHALVVNTILMELYFNGDLIYFLASVRSKLIENVSIIIPTYKRPTNLLNALTSVAEQDYLNKEIIVVNDTGAGSEYNSEISNVIQQVRGAYPLVDIKFIEHNENRNGAAARNTGLLVSTGEYICFLDDDDIYLQGRLSESIAKLANQPSHVGAVYCGFLGWNSPKNDLNRYAEGDLTKEILLLEYLKHYVHTNTVTYRRSAVLALNGFDESYQGWGYEDSDLVIRIMNKGVFRLEGRFAIPVIHLWHPLRLVSTPPTDGLY